MKIHIFLFSILLLLLNGCRAVNYVEKIDKNYFPVKGDWQQVRPEQLGMNSNKLDEAIKIFRKIATGKRAQVWYAKGKDPVIFQKTLLKQYFKDTSEIYGAMKARSGINMMVIKNGYIVAKYGDIEKPDMLGRATRGFVGSLTGIAIQEKLIQNENDFISQKFPEYFKKNEQKNTWHHFLQGTAAWTGKLWNKSLKIRPDAVPGKYFIGSDVHANLLILLLSRLWDKSLVDVLRESILDPIGASDNWQWHGYSNSKYKIHGKEETIPVSGNHWGGGLWMSSADFARYGLLYLNKGNWAGKQIIPENWIRKSFTPSLTKNKHIPRGYMWSFRYNYRSDSANQNIQKPLGLQVAAFLWGRGYRILYIIPEYQLVIVTSFIPPIGLHGEENPVLSKIIESVDPEFMNRDLQREKNIMLVIKGVHPKSTANKLGIKAKDIVYKINGSEIYGTNSLINQRMKAIKAKKKIIMTILRDGKEIDFDITNGAAGLALGLKKRNLQR